MAQIAAETTAPASEDKASPYAWYVLSLLVVVYILNFIDRQVLTILSEDLKRDLNITDSDFGFLYGTAFGVFYSLFGIPLGKLADSWHRVRLLTTGLAVWSVMTTLSGFSKNFVQLSAARVGVGVGEATAGPCAYSLISDYFPQRNRATALAIYSAGLYLGGGLSLFIGGAIVENWNAAYAPGTAPMGLAGWQAAFLAVGIPGLLLAAWVATLREPLRGQADGIATTTSPTPFRDFVNELLTVIPPFTFIGAFLRGGKAFAINLVAALFIGGSAFAMMRFTGDTLQWGAIGIGVYAVFSWASALRERDYPAFHLIWGTPAFLCVAIGYGLISFQAYAVSAFAPAYVIRTFGVPASEAGFLIGGTGAAGGAIGVIAGGWLADRLRRSNPAGRVLVVLLGLLGPILPFVISFTTDSVWLFYVLHLPMTALASAALGAAAACVVGLVLPRMRGMATATFFIATTLVGLSLGPYLAGKVSHLSGDLGTGLLSVLAVVPISLTCLLYAYRAVPRAEATLLERARAAGEPG